MKDIEILVLDVIYNCGGITKKGIELLNGTDFMLKDLLDRKILKKQPVEIEGKKIALYTITDIGEKYYAEKTNKKYFFRCSRGLKIVALSYFYISMLDHCSDWKNKDEWYSEGESGLIPDATFTQDSEEYGIIVIRESEKDRNSEDLLNFSMKHNLHQIKRMCR